MLDPEPRGEGDENVREERQEMADVLLVYNALNHQREHREEEVFGELEPEKDA
ncbi:MAG TPA: hypothetical protein VE913_19850 [Longimicrobium sp.]|nr:hypothetical protein [Longimicrobium sp.]